jgi:hypothetical protein
MIEAGEVGHGKVHRVAPLVLGVMHLASCLVGLVVVDRILSESLRSDSIIWLVVELSPILMVVIVRRIGVLIGAMAVPIVAIFCARIYHLTLFLESNHLNPKGELEDWLSPFFGLISMAGIAAWIFTRVSIFLVECFGRAIANYRATKK